MIVVNRSSSLSWMISQWFCWSRDMHKLVLIYHPTLLFYCFCLKSLTNVNFKIKKDNELQKPSHILVFDKEKGKATFMKMNDAQKAKGLLISWNIKNFRHWSHNEMCCFKKIKWYVEHGAKWKTSKILYSSICGRSYMHISIIEMGHII